MSGCVVWRYARKSYLCGEHCKAASAALPMSTPKGNGYYKASPAIFKSDSIESSTRKVAARLSSVQEKESGIVLPQSKAAAAAEGRSIIF